MYIFCFIYVIGSSDTRFDNEKWMNAHASAMDNDYRNTLLTSQMWRRNTTEYKKKNQTNDLTMCLEEEDEKEIRERKDEQTLRIHKQCLLIHTYIMILYGKCKFVYVFIVFVLKCIRYSTEYVYHWVFAAASMNKWKMKSEEADSRLYICIILSCKASEWEIYAFNAFLTQLKSIRSKITLCCQTFNKIIYSVVATDISYHTWRRLFRVNIVSWLSYLPLKANFLIFIQCLLNLLHSFGLPVANCSSKQRISELATHSFYNNYYSKMCV